MDRDKKIEASGERQRRKKIADCRGWSFVIRHSSFRLGISLTEVLIAMGILTLGLLGVAALFPVGGYYMQKAEIADNGSAIARSALADIVSRGMLDPETWRAYEYRSSPPGEWAGRMFTKPYAAELRTRINQFRSSYGSGVVAQGPDEAPLNVLGQQQLNREFGSFYVLDPLGASSAEGPVAAYRPGWAVFPFINRNPANLAQGAWPTIVLPYLRNSPAWRPWTGGDSVNPRDTEWPIARLTFSIPDLTGVEPYVPMTRAIAEKLFTSQDNLALDLPDRDDLPSIQRWDIKAGAPLARQWTGDYSWIVTILPKTVGARNTLSGPKTNSYDYDVSVVVFYKRLIDSIVDTEPAQQYDDYASGELYVSAAIKSTGPSGGEVLLTANAMAIQPFDELKVGQWLLLCGPHPMSTDLRPMFFAQWYRVVAIDETIEPADYMMSQVTGQRAEQRYVSLRGPQWPWQPENNVQANALLSNNLAVVICPGAVAVHTRTMQLERPSPWSVE
jgi:hypothetical protein